MGQVGLGGIDDDAVLAASALPSLAATQALSQDIEELSQKLAALMSLQASNQALRNEIENLERIASLGQDARIGALNQRIDDLEKLCLSQLNS